jgi:uncharacterized protein YrzB (UPF0473 family)
MKVASLAQSAHLALYPTDDTYSDYECDRVGNTEQCLPDEKDESFSWINEIFAHFIIAKRGKQDIWALAAHLALDPTDETYSNFKSNRVGITEQCPDNKDESFSWINEILAHFNIAKRGKQDIWALAAQLWYVMSTHQA